MKWAWQNQRIAVFRRVRVHPLFLLLLILAWISGFFIDILVLFILIILHELGHAMVAQELGYTVESVSLLPFGGVAKIRYGMMGFQPKYDALVAIAGPLVNLVLALAAAGFYLTHIWSIGFFHTVIKFNLWIVVFNLLPCLPLDGGRILRAARSRSVGFEHATREAYNVAIIVAVILLAVGTLTLWAGHPHIGIIVLGVFLLLTAISGLRDVRFETIHFLDSLRSRKHGQAQIVRAIALSKTASVREATLRFAPDRYHLVYVLSDDGKIERIIGEKTLIHAVFAGQWLTPIAELENPPST